MALFPSRSTLTQLPRFALDAACVHILQQASQYRQTLLAQIAAAQVRIYLCSLYLQHDEAGAEVLAALHAAKAARPGLDIVVLVDWHRAQRGLIGAAKAAGKVANKAARKALGNSAWYQQQAKTHATSVPIYGVPIQTRELFGVLHLKGFVIDDTVIYSGASLNNVYLHKFDKYRHDRYLLLQNRELADAMTHFLRHAVLSSPAVLRLDAATIPETRNIKRQIIQFRAKLKQAHYPLPPVNASLTELTVTPLVGVGKDNPLNRVLCQLLAASETQIMICTPYFNFPLAITREINRALSRGVKIDIIVGDKTANDFYIPPEQPFTAIGALPYLYEVNLRRFAQKQQAFIDKGQLNIHLWREGENSYHLKGMWIDQHYSLMTGNNLNPRAFRLDLENALLIHDPKHELLPQQQAEQASILRDTTQLLHYSWLEQVLDYPPAVTKLLKRLSRTRLDRLFYRVL